MLLTNIRKNGLILAKLTNVKPFFNMIKKRMNHFKGGRTYGIKGKQDRSKFKDSICGRI